MGSFIEAVRGNLRFANREKKQQGLTGDEMRRYVAQYTDEPLAVVNERFNTRFADPQVRSHLADAYRAYIHAFNDHAYLDEQYKASVDLFSVFLFGAQYQEVDLETCIVPTQKDSERIDKLSDARDALSDYNLGNAKELLVGIPLPKGSECDEGLYNNYTHEVLFATGVAAMGLSADIEQPTTKPRKKQYRSAHDLARSANAIVQGLLSSDRSVIMDEIIEFSPNPLPLQELKHK